MKNYREMADSVFERSRVIIEQKIKKRKLLQRISAAASCCCLVALLSFGAWRSGAFDGRRSWQRLTPGRAPARRTARPKPTSLQDRAITRNRSRINLRKTVSLRITARGTTTSRIRRGRTLPMKRKGNCPAAEPNRSVRGRGAACGIQYRPRKP